MSTMTLEQVRDELRATSDHADNGYDKAWAIRLADAIDAYLRERESAKAAVTDSDAFGRGFVCGYEGGLGAAAAECRRQASALDHAGNEYIRYADAIKCAAAIGALRPPELNEPSGNSGELPIYQYRYMSLREQGVGDCESHPGWIDCSRQEFDRYSTYSECLTRAVYLAVAPMLANAHANQEPYCYTVEQKNGLSQGAMCRTKAECEASPLFDPDSDHIIPLYREPMLASARVPDERKAVMYADESRQDQYEAAIYDKGWNDCRKAMLAAAPKPEAEE